MKRFITLAFLAVFTIAEMSAQSVAPFKKGDRVTFVGNSITDGGHYHSYIWLYYMTHFPYENMWMANCGIGGDTSENILKRLDGDVFSKRPTVLTLTFGMNDTGYYEYNGDNAEAFGNGKVAWSHGKYLEIEKRLKGLTDTRIVMIGTSPYDDTSKFNKDIFKNKNTYIQKIVAFQDSAAKANKWEFVDFNAPMTQMNHDFQKADSTFTICGNDRIHPDNNGHMVMAYIFLKAQGMAGKCVADINVNAKSRKVLKSDNCEISNVENNHGTVTFDYLAKSLPYPLDTIAHGWGSKKPQADIVRVIPSFMKDMNNENLAVQGLKGSYQLLIDDVLIDTLTASQLTSGVNLAEYRHTPQYQQACKIMALNEDRWEIERKFRDYAWLQYDFFMEKGLLDVNDEHAARVFREGQKTNGWVGARRELYDKMIHKEVRDAMTAQMDLLVKTIYKINKPEVRHITLSPIK
jgi:lysophospholipase L1-like esterase